MGEGDVDTGHWDQSLIAPLPAVVNILAIFQNLGSSLDSSREFDELTSETLYIGDLEEVVGFCLLGKTAPVARYVSPILGQSSHLTRYRLGCCQDLRDRAQELVVGT
jgi:hypothetical protein